MQTQSHVVPDDPSQVSDILNQLQNNFRTGVTRSADFRKHALSRLLTGLKEMKGEFQQACQKDLGVNEFLFHIFHYAASVTQIDDLMNNFKKWMKPRKIDTPLVLGNASCSVQYDPLGVVLVLSAWNYPIYTALPQVAAAICAGNCVLLKPSEIANQNSRVLKKLFDKYLDPKYFICVEGKVEVAKAVSRLPFDMICFTGSTFTGRLVGIEAAKNLTPCLLELGGKCPTIIDESANLQSAANRILTARFLNCGQTCTAVDHLFVHESVFQKFKNVMMRKLKQGYTDEDYKSGSFGRIISQARFDRLSELLDEKHEGTVLYGGNVDRDNFYFPPTVVQNPRKDSLMMNEEIFGPILPLYSFKELSEVIKEINGRDKPLAVYMFSEKKKNIEAVKTQTQSGCFSVNEATIQVANSHLPFGGVGKSGYGRYHGEAGFKYFSNQRSIVNSKSGDMYPMTARFPPFTEKSKNLLLKLANFGHITYSQICNFLILIFVLVAIAVGLGVGLSALSNNQ